ncbi:MAG: hypothetical protein J5669_02315 [Bacteroidales bacterium]|nr:hypothetical protein [Bacteroidales bacterium]
MKKIVYILAAAAVLLSCVQEQFQHPSEGQVPTASNYTPVITVDQKTNFVTFSVDAQAIIPVWIFQDKDGEWTDTKTGNGYKRLFSSAGDYQVRMQVMNASGVSPDYVQASFHVDNTLVNYDKYYTILSKGPWHIDGNTPGHMACGESVDKPDNWWSAPANDKAAYGVYDNQLSFTSEGKYTFDPGTAGTVYVNIGVTVQPYVNAKGDATADYCAPAELQTTDFKFEVSGEDLYMVFEPGAYFPYIPNDEFVSDTRLLVKDLTAKSVTLVSFNGSIAWQFILTNQTGGGEEPGPQPGGYTYGENLLTGLELNTTWFSAADWSGTLDCGAVYADGKLTLTVPEGIGGSEWQGQVKLVAPVPADPEKQYAFFATIESTTDGTCTVKLADANADAEHSFFYDNNVKLTAFDPAAYKNEPTVPDQAYEGVMVIFDFGRMAAGTEITVSNIELKEITGGSPGGGDGGYTYGDDLLTGLELNTTWFSAADWSGTLDCGAVFADGKLTLTVPDGIGGSEWQGQVKLVAPVPADPEKEYAFFATIESTTDGTCTVKLADANADAEHAFFYDNNVKLAAYDAVAYKNEPAVPDQAYEGVMVIFDFGRMAAGTEITVTGIQLKEITGGTPGGGGEDPGSGSSYGDNMLTGLELNTTWFSAADWSGTLDCGAVYADGKLTLTVPDGIGGSEWQGQVKMVAPVPADPEKKYEFTCKIESTSDGTCTVKVADANADAEHAFFYDNNVKLEAYDVISYKNEPVSPDQAYDAVMVIFDFGRIPAGTEIVVTDIALRQEK